MEKNLIKTYIYAVISILLGILISPVWAAVVLISFFVVFLINNCKDDNDKEFLIPLFLIGLSLRLIAAALLHFFVINKSFFPGVIESPYDIYGGSLFFDEHNFITAAREIAYGVGDFSQYYFRNAHLALLSWLFSNFGYDPFIGKLINCLAGALTPLIVYRCSRFLYPGYKEARCAALITAFYPSVFFWSITNLRDPIIMFFVILFLFCVLYFLKKPNIIYLLWSFFTIWIINSFRKGYLYLFAGFLAALTLHLFLFLRLKSIRIVLLIACSIFLIAIPFKKNINMVYRNVISTTVNKQFCNSIAGESQGNYLLFTKQEIKSGGKLVGPAQLARAYLKGMSYFIFSPLPWKDYGFMNPAILFQAILWYLSLLFIVLGIVLSLKQGLPEKTVFIFLLLNVSYLAILEGNIGTLFRHRDVLMPVFFIFLARGLVFKLGKRGIS
jgi:4-amino-4-deoxy-L-arabinose transferase-like glycosyltransferase